MSPPRKYDLLQEGQRFGSRVVTRVLPRTKRRDERIAWACDCGKSGSSYAFNFRNYPKDCRHAGRPRKVAA